MQLDPSISSSIPSELTLQAEVITYMDSDLFKAAENGDMELFNKYQGGLHCLSKLINGFCFFGKGDLKEFSINFVKQLIDECPSLLLQPNAKGEIPLHVAVRHGHSDIIKFLIERAKDLEATRMKQMLEMADKEGNTALHKAAESADRDVVRLLVKELDPDFSSSANKSGETPIYIAAGRRSNLLVAGILDNCKSMDCGGPDGRTALHAATMARNKESVRIIIEAKKHLTKETDDKGRTPLHYAVQFRSRSIAQLLLKADPSAAYITDKERGTTALHMAAWSGRTNIMEDIISYCPGCCEIVDKRGWNFLHFAVMKQIMEFMKDIANNAQVAGMPVHYRFREIAKEVEKKDIPEHEIDPKTRETHLLVATLVATVTFAAAFTVPGGNKSEQGTATLSRDSAFQAFIITGTLAFVSSLLAFFLHFFLVLFPGAKDYFLVRLKHLADWLTVLAMAAMVVAFSTGTYAVLQSSLGAAYRIYNDAAESLSSSSIPSEQPMEEKVITYMDLVLFKAAADGDVEVFSNYQGALDCLIDGSQNTVLHIYSRTGGRLVVKNVKGFLCFQKRVFEREFSINFVEQLVDKCPSLLLQRHANWEIPLHIAAGHGHSGIVKVLIERAKVVLYEDPE
ncbi:ankyrin repeat-containing protein NPR4-like [Durio zibethinus]|uniref:Ankyrin repeat-containing protein NPR4-like n=1 Tax=Durio zibethinus TaxID=66656 RepID=A0A6P5X1F4_DURZI|nr:ankyrin repeat-containing protein NPR4-like [Durio zibethinus]